MDLEGSKSTQNEAFRAVKNLIHLDIYIYAFFLQYGSVTRISLPIGTNGKPLTAIGKFSNAIGKSMIGKTLATNREEITNAMVDNDVLAIYW